VTYVDRKSMYLLSGLTNGKYARSITEKTVELFKSIPKRLRKSITLDNGKEFVEHYMWKKLCGVEKTYFADIGNP
jgi:transposase, IS30 family